MKQITRNTTNFICLALIVLSVLGCKTISKFYDNNKSDTVSDSMGYQTKILGRWNRVVPGHKVSVTFNRSTIDIILDGKDMGSMNYRFIEDDVTQTDMPNGMVANCRVLIEGDSMTQRCSSAGKDTTVTYTR